MQIQQLSYFVAVARTRHFTRAAELTGVSQPSLSKQIRVLENSLGTPLFARNRGAIELTSAGAALLPHAQRILIDVESAERTVKEVANLRRGRVRLGATPSLCDGLLPEALRRFHNLYPDIDLEVQEAGSQVLTRELAQGRLDVALITDAPDIETTPVLREQLVLASATSSDMPVRMNVSALKDIPLVMFREGYYRRDVTLRACRDAGFEPRFAVEGGEMSAVLRFVESGLGCAVVPNMVLTNRPALRATQLDNPPLDRVIALAHRSSEALPLAARAFKAELLAHLTTVATGALVV